jgi:hypothetical protein
MIKNENISIYLALRAPLPSKLDLSSNTSKLAEIFRIC